MKLKKGNTKLTLLSLAFTSMLLSLVALDYSYNTKEIEKRELDSLKISLTVASNALSSYVSRNEKEIYPSILNIDHPINLTEIEMTDNMGNSLYHRKYILSSPDKITDRISYLFYGEDTISYSIDIVHNLVDDNVFLANDSRVTVGNLMVSISVYPLYSRAINDGIIQISLILLFVFIFNVFVRVSYRKDVAALKSISIAISKDQLDISGFDNIQEHKYKDLVKSIKEQAKKKSREINKITNDSLRENSKLKDEVEKRQSKLNQVIQVKGQYLSLFNSISNDIKNPLQTIIVLTSEIEKANLTEEQLSQCKIIAAASDEILKLSDKITNDYLISESDNRSTNENIDLIEQLGIKISSFQLVTEQRQISTFFSIEKDFSNYIYLNWQGISSVLSNIVNCISENFGGSYIHIKASIVSDRINLSIISDGKNNLTESYIDELSHPAFSESSSIEDKLMLTLSLIKTNIQSLNGRYKIRKNNNITEFNMSLPIKNKEKESPNQAKKVNIIKKSDIDLVFFDDKTSFTFAMMSILSAFSIDVKLIDDLKSYSPDKEKTILLGRDLSSINDIDSLSVFFHVASFENENIKTNLEAINTIFSIYTHPYNIVEKIININETRSISRIGSINANIFNNQRASTNPLANILSSHSSEGPLNGYKILLIDEHSGSLESTKIIIESLDSSVTTASNVFEAENLIRGKMFDVIITDYELKNGSKIKDLIEFTRLSRVNKDAYFICHTSNIEINTDKETNELFGSVIIKPSNNKSMWIKKIMKAPKRKSHMTLV